jgi:hypothetical protein
MVPSPPSVLTGEPISNSHVDVYIHSPVFLDVDLDLLSYSKDNTSNHSKTNIESGTQQKIRTVNSLISLNERTVISLLPGQSSISKSFNSRSSSQTHRKEKLHKKNRTEK